MTLHRTTAAIHSQHHAGDDAHAEPIWMTTAYDFESAEAASARFSGRQPGNIYSRFTNPSLSDFEARLAAMEEGETAIGVASGMAAYLAVSMAFLRQGDEVLLAGGIFGSTSHLFRQYLGPFGVSSRSLPPGRIGAWRQAIGPRTRLLIVESPTNPTMAVSDIAALARLAHEHDALLLVDNTLLTPVFQQPLKQGADLVLHSAGKYIDGQGRCVGGAVVGAEHRIAPIRAVLRSAGMCLSPFNAWVFTKGLETLRARMMAHEQNTHRVLSWLRSHPAVTNICYTGCPDRQDRRLITRQQQGHGALLSFEIAGGHHAAWCFINHLKLVCRCTNIGDAKTLVTHPWSTTHCKYSEAEKRQFGITPGLLRLSIGLEAPGDIVGDLQQALATACLIERKTA